MYTSIIHDYLYLHYLISKRSDVDYSGYKQINQLVVLPPYASSVFNQPSKDLPSPHRNMITRIDTKIVIIEDDEPEDIYKLICRNIGIPRSGYVPNRRVRMVVGERHLPTNGKCPAVSITFILGQVNLSSTWTAADLHICEEALLQEENLSGYEIVFVYSDTPLPFGQRNSQIVLGVPVDVGGAVVGGAVVGGAVAVVVRRQQAPTQTLGLHL